MAAKRKSRRRRKAGLFRRCWSLIATPEGRHRLGVFTITILVLALALGVGWGLQRLERFVRKDRSEHQTGITLRLLHQPAWMQRFGDLPQEILASAGITPDDFILDKALARRTGEKLAENPWIRRLRRVSKQPDNTLLIDCEFRRPLTAVRHQDVYYLVDDEGVRLPGVWKEHDLDSLGMKRLFGVASQPPVPGQRWEVEDLAAGLKLLLLLEPHPYYRQIHAVHVDNFSGRKDPRRAHLTLTTPHATQIRWGRAAGTEGRLELPVRGKLENLREVYEKFQTLDGPLEYIDLRDPQPRYRLRDPASPPT